MRCSFVETVLDPLDLVCNLVGVVADLLWRVSSGLPARDMFDTTAEVVEAQLHPGEIIVAIVAALRGLRLLEHLTARLLEDDGVEPFVQRQSGPASGSLRGFAGFVANAFDAPRKAKSHAHTRIRGGVAESPDRLSWNQGTLMTG